jgi:hypothetical protein
MFFLLNWSIKRFATKTVKKMTALTQRQLQQWIAGLPKYIMAYFKLQKLSYLLFSMTAK